MALAQTRPASQSIAADRVRALPVRKYQISAGTLGSVLEEFRKTSEASVEVSDPALLGIQSPGVNGTYTEEQALAQLLSETNLVYSSTQSGSFAIRLKEASASVDVSADAPTVSSSMPKYQQPLLDTPQTVGVVRKQTIAAAGRDHLARYASQRCRYQPGGGRRRIAGRQPDHPRLHGPQRSVHRRHARLRQLLPRSVQYPGSRSAARAVVGHIRPWFHRRRSQSGE